MRKNYPHKQTIIIAVVCILAVGATIAYAHRQTSQNSTDVQVNTMPKYDVPLLGQPIASTTFSNDWKKAFFTYASSTTSGFKISNKVDSNIEASDPSSLTQKFSRQFFVNYIQLKQSNLDGDTQLVEDTLNKSLDDVFTTAGKARKYTSKDVLLADASTESLRNYGNVAGDILFFTMPRTDPTSIASEALNTSDFSLLSGIDPIIVSYESTINKLLATKVPQPLLQYHLDTLNSISSLLFTAKGLTNIQGDTMQSIVNLTTYTQTQDEFEKALTDIGKYYKDNKINFGENEGGMLFQSTQQ